MNIEYCSTYSTLKLSPTPRTPCWSTLTLMWQRFHRHGVGRPTPRLPPATPCSVLSSDRPTQLRAHPFRSLRSRDGVCQPAGLVAHHEGWLSSRCSALDSRFVPLCLTLQVVTGNYVASLSGALRLLHRRKVVDTDPRQSRYITTPASTSWAFLSQRDQVWTANPKPHQDCLINRS